jgi:hypothetical protein
MLVEVLDDTDISCFLRGNLQSWLVYRTGFSSDRRPVSGVGEHSRGCRMWATRSAACSVVGRSLSGGAPTIHCLLSAFALS